MIKPDEVIRLEELLSRQEELSDEMMEVPFEDTDTLNRISDELAEIMEETDKLVEIMNTPEYLEEFLNS